MAKNKKIKKNNTVQAFGKESRPTLLEFMASFHAEAGEQFGTPFKINPDVPVRPLPEWAKKTVTQLGKTVMKPILKLRPSKKTTCQEFGKIIGIIGRGITFYTKDVWRIIEAEGLDKISDEDWEKIQPAKQRRTLAIKKLGRRVMKEEKTEDLELELIERQISQWHEMRQRAFRVMAQRSAKENGAFLRGIEQGYQSFLGEDAEFCGDRGRTNIYLELFSSLHEIEKMRRMLPARNDVDLYHHLKPWYRFPGDPQQAVAWLRKVCDDISLYMTGKRGRRFCPLAAPVF